MAAADRCHPLSRHLYSGGWVEGAIMAIDVQTVVKYGQDFVYTMSVTGAELLVALENSVSLINTGRFVQVRRRGFFLAQLLPVRTELTTLAHHRTRTTAHRFLVSSSPGTATKMSVGAWWTLGVSTLRAGPS